MQFLRTRRPFQWIAIMAMLLAALVPTVSRAVSFASGTTWVEVCTARGTAWVAAGEASSESPPSGEHALEQCSYCTGHLPALGLPPSPSMHPVLEARGDALPAAFLAAPRTLHAWASAQPRAPPLFS